jgi:genome maintenance exonuclease 1
MFTHELVELTPLSTTTIDGKRHYQTPDGNVYPSVTTITSLHGKEGILEWRKRVGEEEANKISNKAATRGTRVHKLCEDYLNNELSFEGAMPNSIALFKQMQPFLDKYIGKVYGIECPLYSHHLRVAGKSDCIAQFDGKNAVVDFKTANKPKQEHWIQNYFMQTTAYAEMFEEMTGKVINQIVLVFALVEGGSQIIVKQKHDYLKPLNEYIDFYWSGINEEYA